MQEKGMHCQMVEVVDANDIDREVTKYKPTKVIVEALWVVPSKFGELAKIHQKVEWFIHMHSDVPFLAIEGIATEWLQEYPKYGVGIIANSTETDEAYQAMDLGNVNFLPNIYMHPMMSPVVNYDFGIINIGCFGAIRPMKDHLLQALAAIKFAHQLGRPLRFHINGSRIETGGDPVMKNLKKLFEPRVDAELVLRPWYEPEDFIKMMHNEIDICMQVSLAETFNIASADAVAAGVPIVVSDEIKWASRFNKVSDHSVDHVVEKMHFVWDKPSLVKWNQRLLRNTSKEATKMWYEFLRG